MRSGALPRPRRSGRDDALPLPLVPAGERRHQRRMGGVRKIGVRMAGGEPIAYSSSPGIEWLHCHQCGSLVGYRRSSRPEHLDITTGTLDDPNLYPPAVEIWLEHKIAWETLDSGLPKRPQSSLNAND